MVQVNDLSRSLTAFDLTSTLVVVVEMSEASWLVSGVVHGVERQPLKKLESDATALLRLHWPMKLAATASGLRAGSSLAGSRRMSSIPRALRYHVSASGRRQIVWMRRC